MNQNNAAHIAALEDLRLGVELDRHHLDDGDAMIAALDAALALLRTPVEEEYTSATGDAAEAYRADLLLALLSKLRAPVADEQDRNATISKVVGLCNRIPGATTWNAAEFMYDEMHRRAALAVADERAAVAYLDLGAGGYMDVGTDLTDKQLAALPKGRHMLAIIGTHGVDGYTPASAPVASRQRLRDLVDVVWNEATESTAVPDTQWADRLIDKVFPAGSASAPVADESAVRRALVAASNYIDTLGGNSKSYRVALASVPVADESPMAKAAEALREKARQERQAYQDRREADRVASAPVAGEAVAALIRERQYLGKGIDGREFYGDFSEWFPASLNYAKSVTAPDRNARGTWQVRWLVDAAPQASAADFPSIDPVQAHVAHCHGCETCDGWREMLGGQRQASTVDGLPVWWGRFMSELTLRSEDEVRNDLPGILEICALEAIGSAACQASEAVRMEDLKAIAREVAADSAAIRAEARNAALEEAAQAAYKALFPTNDRSDWTEFAESASFSAKYAAQCIRALKSQSAALSAQPSKHAWSHCVFHGPAPAGYASWGEWILNPNKRSAFIRAVTAADWAAQPAQKEQSPEWMTCNKRGWMVRESLARNAKQMRADEKRCRNAYNEEYMAAPTRYLADVFAEAAAIFEARLKELPPQKKGGK